MDTAEDLVRLGAGELYSLVGMLQAALELGSTNPVMGLGVIAAYLDAGWGEGHLERHATNYVAPETLQLSRARGRQVATVQALSGGDPKLEGDLHEHPHVWGDRRDRELELPSEQRDEQGRVCQVRVTATDLVEGESESRLVPPDGYCLVLGDDREVTHEQRSANGSITITTRLRRG